MLKTKADRAVLQRLYQENAKKLYCVAWKIVQNKAQAEEAVCACFRKLAEDFSKLRCWEYKNLERLCVIVVKNVAMELAAKHGGGVKRAEGEMRSTSHKSKDSESESVITQALRELEEDERNLLFMKYGLELGPKEIGRLFNMTSTEVQRRILNCSEKLVTALEAKTL